MSDDDIDLNLGAEEVKPAETYLNPRTYKTTAKVHPIDLIIKMIDEQTDITNNP